MRITASERRALLIGMAGALASLGLWAQQKGGAPATPTAPTTGGTSRPTTGVGTSPNPSTNTNPNSNTPQPNGQSQIQRPIFLSGHVVLNDGTPVTEPLVIERVCGTRTYREGYTDSRGYFSIQLGQNQAVMADASTDTLFSNPLGRSNSNGGGPFGGGNSDLSQTAMMGCDLRAVMNGYRSDTISLADRRYMDNPEVGALVLHNMTNVKGLTTSATTALAPKDARKSYEKAIEALKHSKPDEAQKELSKAVELYPKFAAAWFELGRVYERRDHIAEARDAYGKAIAADSNFVNPYERVYMLAAKDAQWQDVADTTDRVLRLNPYDFPGAYYMSAVANYQLKHFDVAEKNAREATQLKGVQAEPRANYVLGVILANKGDFAAAAESLRAYLKLDPNGSDKDRVVKMLADVERAGQAKAEQPKADAAQQQ
jgi:Flp pilus assembly protein TadD